jgi:hypothetical protein
MKMQALLDTFCPDMHLLRNGCVMQDLRDMFLMPTYELRVDTCRAVLMTVPPDSDAGLYAMLRLVDDDDIDVPIRKAAFALLGPTLGIVVGPLQHARGVPTYSHYRAAVRAMASDLEAHGAQGSSYAELKGLVESALPLPVLDSAGLERSRQSVRRIFGLPGDAARPDGGHPPRWITCGAHREPLGQGHRYLTRPAPLAPAPLAPRAGHQDDLAPAEGGAPAGDDAAAAAARADDDGAALEVDATKMTPGTPGALPAPPPPPTRDTIARVNRLARACLRYLTEDPVRLANSDAKCTILLFASTVRSGAHGTAAWPSGPELDARMAAVSGLVSDGAQS